MRLSKLFIAVLHICLFFVAAHAQTAQVASDVVAVPDALTLETATDIFLKRNLSVEAARLEVSVAETERIVARLRPRPGVTVSAENLRLSGPTPFNRLYEAGITIAQPFELGGQRKLRLEVAERTVSIAEAQLANALRQRLFELKQTYYEVVLAQALLAIEKENQDNFADLMRFNTVRFQEGYIAEGELIKVRLERIKYDSAIANAALNLRQAKIRLMGMLGESDFTSVESLDVRGALNFREVTLGLVELREKALTNRTDIKVFETVLSRSESATKLEYARGKGELVPFIGYKRVGVDNTMLAGVSVPLPFSNRNQGAIARAEAERRVAETNVHIARNRALAEVESAYSAYETAREQVRAYETGILNQADESRNISLSAYREGAAELITLLDAQRTRTEIRSGYYKILLAYQMSLFQIELATGTGVTK